MNNKSYDPLSLLMQKAELKLPSDHFEDHLMQLILIENKGTERVSRDKNLSSIFFILGILLGFVLNTFIKYMPLEAVHLPRNITTLIFQVVFVLIILIQFDKNKSVLRQWFWQALGK